MTRREQIIAELEKVHGVELDVDFDAGVNELCGYLSCLQECGCCDDNFRDAVDAELKLSILSEPELEQMMGL